MTNDSQNECTKAVLLAAACVFGPLLHGIATGKPLWIGATVSGIVVALLVVLAIHAWRTRPRESNCPDCAGGGDVWTCDALHRRDIDAITRRIVEDPSYCVPAEDEVSPLQLSVAHDELELVNTILAKRADSFRDSPASNDCIMAALSSQKPNSTQILAKLIQAGFDIRFNGYGGWMCGPLHWVADDGDVDKGCLLLDAGADVNERTEDIDGSTSLMFAASAGRAQMVQLLLERGANPTLTDACGSTPLDRALNAADMEVQERVHGTTEQIHAQALDHLSALPGRISQESRKAYAEIYAKQLEEQRRKALTLATSGELQEVIRILRSVNSTVNDEAGFPDETKDNV